jgi:RHS repeat-associated protein
MLQNYQQRYFAGEQTWIGSLAGQQRDPAGALYMRNRYYDSQTGRFTQEDPIGLAGGLNRYGFAAGDPISYNDPFGLIVQCATDDACKLWNALVRLAMAGLRSNSFRTRYNAKTLTSVLTSVWNSKKTYTIDVGNKGFLFRWFTGSGVGYPTQDGWYIAVDPSHQTEDFSMTTLAHELGHGEARTESGADREQSDNAAVDAEDHARALLHCRPRVIHEEDPGVCP